jgi:hypothetical protein
MVLALLDAGPRRPHDIARTLGGDFPAARTALRRLEEAGLVRRRLLGGAADYLLTGRGRRELRLQRSLWKRVVLHALAEPR